MFEDVKPEDIEEIAKLLKALHDGEGEDIRSLHGCKIDRGEIPAPTKGQFRQMVVLISEFIINNSPTGLLDPEQVFMLIRDGYVMGFEAARDQE